MFERSRFALPLSVIATLCVPGLALAHPGHEGLTGFSAGLLHPWSGFDHLLAMLAVGLWAGQQSGRARGSIPASFVAAMTAGSALGMAGAAAPGVEAGILLSVVALGALVATSLHVPAMAAAALVAAFGVLHGAAHGVEMPADASGASYAGGFVLATAGLHALGLGLARVPVSTVVRGSGAAIAASGLLLIAGSLV